MKHKLKQIPKRIPKRKPKRILILLISLIILGLAGFSVIWIGFHEHPSPAELILLNSGKDIQVFSGSYHVKGLFTTEDFDAKPIDEIFDYAPITKVTKNSKSFFKFSRKPDIMLVYEVVKGISSEYHSEKDYITMPSEAGTYTFQIDTKQNTNTATYYFQVQVE